MSRADDDALGWLLAAWLAYQVVKQQMVRAAVRRGVERGRRLVESITS